ncbi:MAG TPA: hypothetical protein VFE46_07455, partial [Pirellulales bacterium]|nr:hypothetical protein [Pirellulales bacterium]
MLTTVRNLRKLICLVSVVCAIAAFRAKAANLTWDSDGVPPVTDGSNFWDTLPTNIFWFTGTSDVVWDSVSTALFGAGNGTAPYTVTIDDGSGTVNAAGLTFNNPGTGASYTIAASGSDTLTLNVANPLISIGTGVSAAISAPIAGAFNSSTGTNNTTGLIIKSLSGNTGTLTLSGASTYTGSTIIESSGAANTGTAVALTGAATLGSSGSNVYIAFN